jgi:hypothetical protein
MEIALPEQITKRVSVKNVKSGFGHDLMGLFADIYLDKKKVGHYNDDGWGGEVDLQLTTTARETIEKLALECNVAQLLFDNGWGFLNTIDRVTTQIQVEQIAFSLIDAILTEKEDKKFRKKLDKDMVKGICIGTEKRYALHSFKHPLADMVRLIGAGGVKQSIKVNLLPKIKEGDRILNTNLKELGIDLEI